MFTSVRDLIPRLSELELGIQPICILMVFQVPAMLSRILLVSKSAVYSYFKKYLLSQCLSGSGCSKDQENYN